MTRVCASEVIKFRRCRLTTHLVSVKLIDLGVVVVGADEGGVSGAPPQRAPRRRHTPLPHTPHAAAVTSVSSGTLQTSNRYLERGLTPWAMHIELYGIRCKEVLVTGRCTIKSFPDRFAFDSLEVQIDSIAPTVY
ncbi:hypothetical protein J6590_013522 [Homalodisca vitripennis]|nr:hypothetical protein J6590_013522 [Homalodisca vitripennis]